jgi:guanine deaminase
VRQAFLVSRHVGFLKGGDSRFNIGVAEGLYLATVGGARVVGMEGKLGGFETGMFWDTQEIQLGMVGGDGNGGAGAVTGTGVGVGSDLGVVDVFGWETIEEKVVKWVWNGDDRNVRRVWVGGRLVHERR